MSKDFNTKTSRVTFLRLLSGIREKACLTARHRAALTLACRKSFLRHDQLFLSREAVDLWKVTSALSSKKLIVALKD